MTSGVMNKNWLYFNMIILFFKKQYFLNKIITK